MLQTYDYFSNQQKKVAISEGYNQIILESLNHYPPPKCNKTDLPPLLFA